MNSPDVDKMNRSACEFVQKTQEEFDRICEPLFKNFPITIFSYMKIFEDGRYFSLNSNLKWQEHRFKNIHTNGDFFSKEAQKVTENQTRQFLWPQSPKDDFFIELYKFNICYGFSKNKRSKGFIESWSFATDGNNENIEGFYIENLQYLEHFINYFMVKAAHLIDVTDSSKLALFKGDINIKASKDRASNSNINNFFKETCLQKYNFKSPAGSIAYLSKRQIECLYLLSHGKTMKEIALSLDISPRTVETYLNYVKLLTGLNYRSQLVQFFLRNFRKIPLDEKITAYESS